MNRWRRFKTDAKRWRNIRRKLAASHTVLPHLNASGGCRCDCDHCVTIVRVPAATIYPSDSGYYRRLCICLECSHDCSNFRGPDGRTELGRIDER